MARKKLSKNIPSNAVGGQGNSALAILIGGTVGIAGGSGAAMAGPTGGEITNGQGSISTPSDTATVIDQSSNALSIDWRSFDIAANESVRFNQPTTNSVAVNRILDQKPSEIFGRLDSNGRVVLVNSNGVLFGPGSQVNVGSLLATSLNVVSFDETTGRLSLSAAGTPGAIVNDGTITAGPNGSVSLVGGSVANNGLIVAEYGSVNLAAGRAATIDFYGGGLLRFDADSSLTQNVDGAAAGVSNAGQIQANGGQVLLTTSAARNVFDRAVNNDGVVRANRIDSVGGVIRLVGENGAVASSGVLDASGVGAGSSGGAVQVLGDKVGLLGAAVVDVSGDAGGGLALIGGDFQGKNLDILNAERTIVASGASIHADARISGDGGRVIVWSDGFTSYRGNITARGGAESGNGGFAEVSGKQLLDFNGGVNMSAAHGTNGRLLLDPEEINIETTGSTDVDWDFNEPGPVPVPPPDLVTVDRDSINAALNTTSVELQATDTIRVNASITGTGLNNGLTLRAGDNINIADGVGISTNNGTIRLSAGDNLTIPVSAVDTGDVDFLGAGSLNSGNAAVFLTSDGDLDLPNGAITGGVVTLNVGGALTDGNGVSITASQLVIAGADSAADSVNLNANIGSLDAINVTGALTLNAQGANAANFTVNRANAGGAVTIDSTGAILDDDEGTASVTNISGSSITLTAATQIGNVADLRAGTGSSVDVNTTGPLVATVTSNTGQMNLNLVAVPTLTDNDLALGTAAGAAVGTMLLQRSANFNVAAIVDDAILLGTNSSNVGFRSDGTLTLPANNAFNDIFSTAPGTLALHGNDIVDNNGTPRALEFTGFTNLIFDSVTPAAAYTLDTTIQLLVADIGGNVGLTVNETTGINLSEVIVDGAVSVTAGADIIAGVVTSDTATVSLTSTGGDIDDDANNATAITGTTVTLSAEAIGATGTNNEIDTNAVNLALNATDGDLVVRDVDDVNIASFAAIDGAQTRIETTNGAITTAVDLRPTTGSLTLIARGAGSNLDFTGRTLGRTTGAGDVTIQAGGNITTGTVIATNATLSAGFEGAAGRNLMIGSVTGTGNVTARATGAIGDDILSATPSVIAATLTIDDASSVELDTNVNTLVASGIDTSLTIREQTGALAVTNAAAGGAVNLSTVAGNLNITTVASGGGNAVALTAGGVGSDILLGAGTVTASGGAGDVTLTADGDITDASPSTAVSVIADELTITDGSVDLDTNVNSLNASGATSLAIRERTGALNVSNAAATGAVNVSTIGGALTVASASGNAVTLGAGGASSALTLDTVTAVTNVSLSAGGAITDGALATPSVVANRLVISAAGSADLDSNVNILDAAAITGALTVREQAGNLQVDDATAGGAVNLTTVAGDLTGVNADGAGVMLSSSGAIALLDVDANAGTASLTAAGAITGGAGAVSGNRLSITQASSVNLGTDVVTLNAIGVTGNLSITDANNVTIEDVTAVGDVALASTTGAILDDDGGTTNATRISGVNVALSAATGIGSVTNFTTGAGSSVDVNVAGPGTLSATVAANNGAINLNISGAPVIGIGGITLGSNPGVATGTVVLQSGADLNLGSLTDGAIAVGAGNTASVGYVSGGLLTLRDTGSVTDAAPLNLLVSGADVISGGATPRIIALTAGTLNFNASAAADTFQLNTDVDTLNADVGNVALNVDQIAGAGNLTLGRIVSSALDVDTIAAGGAILDDGDDNTVLTGANISLRAGGAIGSNSNALAAIDVDTPSLFAASYGAGGDVVINSVRTGSTAFFVGASVDNTAAGNGDLIIRAQGDVSAQILQAVGDTVTVTTSGQLLTDAVPVVGLVVNADQLVVTAASGVNLTGTNINTLNASGVAGALSLTESSDALTVTNASATGAVSVATVDGTMTVTNAASSGGAVTLAAGGTGALTIGTATAAGALTASTANGTLTANTATSSGGTVSLTAGGGGALNVINNVTGTGATLTGGAITLTGAVNALSGTATITASGAVTDAAGVNPSVNANQLTITAATSADLYTNVNTLDASGVTANLAIREQSGALAVTNANAAGTVNVSTVNGALTVGTATSGAGLTLTAGGNNALSVTSATGTSASLTGGAMTLGAVNTGAGNATLTATGAITDAAGATPSVIANQLTITAGAASANLDTNINTLVASGVAGALTIREQSGPMTVTNAGATGAIDVSTVAGALTVNNASSNSSSVTLAAGGGGALAVAAASGNNVSLAGGAVTLGVVTATGTASIAASGAVTDAADATRSVVANQLTITSAGSVDLDTNVNTLVASGVTGALTVREQTGALAVTNAAASGAINLSTVAGDLNVTNAVSTGGGITLASGGVGALNVAAASGTSATLNSNAAMTIGNVNAGTGAATLTAVGTITDGSTGSTSLTAAAATLTATSIGSAGNTLNTSVTSLTANSTTGGMFFREANDIALTNLTAASNQDIVVGAVGDITVSQIAVTGVGAAGRVLLAAGRDILSTGTGVHITAQNIEMRAGGLVTTGGRIGASGTPLRLDVPESVPGGGNGSAVPSVLLLQNPGPTGVALQGESIAIVSGGFEIAKAVFPLPQTADNYLTTTFSTRTAEVVGGENLVSVVNAALNVSITAEVDLPSVNAGFSDGSDASNVQGEGTLYIDWASFDPNVSLFGTVNPPICLPRDQQDDDSGESTEGAPDSGAGSGGGSGCASTTAQYDNRSLGLPELRLVITSRGPEWVRVRVPVRQGAGPLRIAQSR